MGSCRTSPPSSASFQCPRHPTKRPSAVSSSTMNSSKSRSSGWRKCGGSNTTARAKAAKRLGITRIGVLDAEVTAKRQALGLRDDDDDDGKQGKPITFNEPEMWPAPVD